MNSKSEFSHFLTHFWGIIRGVQRPTILGSRLYYWCPFVPKETNKHYPSKALALLSSCARGNQMSTSIGNLQKHRISGKQAFSSKYWSVLAVVQTRQIRESKSSTKSGVSWNSFGFSAIFCIWWNDNVFTFYWWKFKGWFEA